MPTNTTATANETLIFDNPLLSFELPYFRYTHPAIHSHIPLSNPPVPEGTRENHKKANELLGKAVQCKQ